MRKPSEDSHRPGVLMVTGAYFPELSGGGLQCKAIVDALGSDVAFTVLTTSTDSTLPAVDEVDGVPVRRVLVDIGSSRSRLRAALAFVGAFVGLSRSFDVVHLHGFSSKSVLAVLLARAFGKRIVLTLHTAEQDEPAAIRERGPLAYWAYSRADLFVAISRRMVDALQNAGFAGRRVARVSNGVDARRFRPAEPEERMRLRAALGLPADGLLILFVGFFSIDKGPRVLFDAWRGVAGDCSSSLVFVGATASAYFEVDPALAAGIRETAARDGLAGRMMFVEQTRTIEEFYRAADVFVFPSRREAFGMALVEAMASGLPCIASHLPGVTDEIVRDGDTGLLVAPHDVAALTAALRRVLQDGALAARLGAAARRDVVARFSIDRTARLTLDAYLRLLEAHPPAAATA